MADFVLQLLKKALSLVTQLSPKLVMIDTTCRVVGYASGKNKVLFMQAIDHGMYMLDCEQRGLTKEISKVDSGDGDGHDGMMILC
jgi:hypothetical protein